MNDFRTAIHKTEAASAPTPVARKQKRRRNGEQSLVDISIPREERRKTNHRREDRFPDVVDRATLIFRRKKLLVRVVNVSGSGVMIESEIMPRIGEAVGLEFENFDRLEAVVRWIRRGRIGLDVGEGAIDLG
jgi:PilZ domain